MDQAHAAIIAAEIAAISSSAVAIVLVLSNLIERRSERKRETMIKALEHLTGGTQKRSVGIALIEGLWYDGHPFDRAIMPALVSQAVYLLLETEGGSHRHEIFNWLRIMELILRVPAKAEYHNLYCEIADALLARIEETQMPAAGIAITRPASKLWLKRLSSHASLQADSYLE